MNREDIARMVREAGGSFDDPSDLLTLQALERFTSLVVAAATLADKAEWTDSDIERAYLAGIEEGRAQMRREEQ